MAAAVRLTPQQQLHEALLCFGKKELHDQGLATGCAALRQADASILPSLYAQLLGRLPAASPAARRMHYRLAAHALRSQGTRAWGTGLLQYVRDRVVARVGQEEGGPVAAELADLAAALAAACLDAYARGEWAAFAAAREDMRAEWLSELLLEPLVREACRGHARTNVSSGCLMAHAVLTELQRQVEAAAAQLKALQRSDRKAARSAATVTASSLHAAAALLKLLLRLGASLPLSCAESMLPLAGCIRLLGPRLRPAAVDGAVRVCCEAMAQPRAEWQVRRAAAETLAELAIALRRPQAQAPPTSGATAAGHADERQTGQAALEGAVPHICEAVLRHLKYDRVPQVRAAAAALLQTLRGSSNSDPAPNSSSVRVNGIAAPRPWRQRQQQLVAKKIGAAKSRDVPVAVLAAKRSQRLLESQDGTAAKDGNHALIPAVRLPQQGARQLQPTTALEASDSSGEAEAECAAEDARPRRRESLQAAAGGGCLDTGTCVLEGRQAPAAGPRACEGAGPPPRQLRASPLRPRFVRPTLRELNLLASRPGDSSPGTGLDFGVQVFALPRPAAAQLAQLAALREAAEAGWRENPLAAGPSAAAVPAPRATDAVHKPSQAPAVVLPHDNIGMPSIPHATAPQLRQHPARPPAVVHHVSHPAFRLRLQSSPTQATLELAGGGAAGASQSAGGACTASSCGMASAGGAGAVLGARIWAGEGHGGAGAEIRLARAASGEVLVQRYWLDDGRLVEGASLERHEEPPALAARQQAEEARTSAGTSPPRPNSSTTMPLPAASEPPTTLQASPQQQMPLDETPPPRPPVQERGVSPPPPQQQQQQQQQDSVLPAVLHAESPLLSLAAGELPSFSLPASPEAVRAPARSMQHSGPAGIESESAANAAVPATGAWVELLRPPEQRVWGEHSEWDGSRPGSPARRRSASSRPASPERRCGASSTPASPERQRSCSRPASPDRQRGGSSRGSSPGGRRASLPQPFNRYGSHASSDDVLQQDQAPAPLPHQASPPHACSDEADEQPEMGSPAPQQQCDSPPAQPPAAAAAAAHGAGPLTAMVNRAVGRLQQLQELQQLVGDVDVRGSGTSDGRAVARPLEPRLSGGGEAGAEAEAAAEGLAATCRSPGAGREAEASSWQAAPSVREVLRCRRLQAAAEGPAPQMPLPPGSGGGGGGELARLQLLQQQLEASMAEINARMEGHQRFAGLAASPALLQPAAPGGSQPAQRQGQQGQEQGQQRPASAASLAISSEGLYDDASPGVSLGGGRGLPNPLFDASPPASPQVQLPTAGAQLTPQAPPSQAPARAAAPVTSTAASLDTLGSGFGGGQVGDADEVLQFLRGSIADPSAATRAAVVPPTAGSRLRQSSCVAAAAPPAAFAPRASLDLQAILGSRPASPAKAREASDSSGGGSGAAAPALVERAAAQLAAVDLHLLRISARPRSPPPAGTPAAGSPATTLAATEVVSPGSARAGSVTPVLQDTFPAEALQRLEALKARLSPSATPPGRRSTSPGGPAAWQVGPGSDSSSGGSRSKSCSGEDGSAAAACRLPSSQPAHQVLPPLRCGSPDLGGGLPRGLTRRGARLLQSAVGRMSGNPGEGADATDIQGALMDVLQQHSEEVQAHYRAAAAERLKGLRREFGHDVALLQRVLEREGAVLAAAQEAAIRGELAAFVDGCLPALADVLASKRLLLRCFELLAEQEETDGEE